jgi:hypothetical protein
MICYGVLYFNGQDSSSFSYLAFGINFLFQVL